MASRSQSHSRLAPEGSGGLSAGGQDSWGHHHRLVQVVPILSPNLMVVVVSLVVVIVVEVVVVVVIVVVVVVVVLVVVEVAVEKSYLCDIGDGAAVGGCGGDRVGDVTVAVVMATTAIVTGISAAVVNDQQRRQ
ncbi:hypothetical protein E2C01_035364 [Portunus trituberculatus]|uniref:Uncharacterized protein n=1 Tax=Portunus trituberculatus TaxID=210409 RepID=A0A5B7F410_PORTR|nr:hypothetical protein [Portunus trituberculatus]